MDFGIKRRKMEVVHGVRLPNRRWREEKLPRLSKISLFN